MNSRLTTETKPDRAALLQSLSQRFYIDEPGTVVSNGLSTDLIVFPSDREPRNRQQLDHKIDTAMAYATTFKDVHELNALHQIPNTNIEPNYYATLGLYLYFADECSRLRPETTFLSELRKVDAGLKFGEKFYRKDIQDKFHKALQNLGMEESHGAILDEWARNVSYTIQGDWNGRGEENGKPVAIGAYARLAHDICSQKNFLGADLPISYALGNKERIRNMTAEEAYTFTKNLTATNKPDPYIRKCIEKGNELRRERIANAIEEQMGPTPVNASHLSSVAVRRSAPEILGYLPDPMLEILSREGYSIAYSNDSTIGKSYLAIPLPLEKPDSNVREDKGIREPHYHTIFISNGYREAGGDDIAKDEKLRFKVVAQTLAHESFHIAIDYLTPEEQNSLRDSVIALGKEIAQRKTADTLPGYMNTDLKTIDPNSLAQVLDYDNKLYNYAITHIVNADKKVVRTDDDRWMEVACNTYSLMQTEFPPDSAGNNPYRDLPALAALKNELLSVQEKALKRCREEHYHAELPNVGQNRTS
jgi:hypothetical protein